MLSGLHSARTVMVFGGNSRGRHLARAIAVIAVIVGVNGAVIDPASAQGSPLVVEICSTVGEIPELGGRVCASFEAGSVALAAVCEELSLPPEVCATIEPDPPDSAAVDAYQDSWVHRALRLQELLDRSEPLVNSLVPHTHNSSNATAYAATVTTFDPNQRYSIFDQLRMDIRGIELDLHWVLGQVVLCHGTSVPVGDLVVHVGCSIDQPLADGLTEIRDFLAAPGNEKVVILLYLENQLDDDPEAHAQAMADVERILGDLVQRPAAGAEGDCVDAPMDESRQDVLDGGAQIVIVGNCGPGPWRDWVHERGPLWHESGYGGSYSYPDCVTAERVERDYDADFIRHWEDLTFVSAMANGEIHHLEPATVHDMVRCGVDMIGFDRLAPFDGRLEALIWSWAPDEPAHELSASCAFRGNDARFRTDDCAALRAFACRHGDGAWAVTDSTGPWSDGDGACRAVGATFDVPPTGWQNHLLGEATGGNEVWIALGAGTPTPAEIAAPPARDPHVGVALPATGASAPLVGAGAALAVAVVLRRLSARGSGR